MQTTRDSSWFGEALAFLSLSSSGGNPNASDKRTSDKYTETRRQAGLRKLSTIRRCPLALLACISQEGLSTPRQYSRRGGCGSGCAAICLQALGPVQGG